MQTTRIVGHAAAIVRADGDAILLRVYLLDTGVVTRVQSQGLASFAVAHHVAWLVALGPLPIRPGDLLTWHQDSHAVVFTLDVAFALHRSVDHLVDVVSRPVVRRDHERVVRVADVLTGDRAQAVLPARNFMDAALAVEFVDCTVNFAARQALDNDLQIRVLLSNDVVQPRRRDAGVLQLLVGPAGVHRFMLASVANQQDAVLRFEALKKCVHLLGARQTGFIKHVQPSGVRARFLYRSRQVTLQRACLNSGVVKFVCCP